MDFPPHNGFHLNARFDILQKIYTDAVVQKYHAQNENKVMIEMIKHTQPINGIINHTIIWRIYKKTHGNM